MLIVKNFMRKYYENRKILTSTVKPNVFKKADITKQKLKSLLNPFSILCVTIASGLSTT